MNKLDNSCFFHKKSETLKKYFFYKSPQNVKNLNATFVFPYGNKKVATTI